MNGRLPGQQSVRRALEVLFSLEGSLGTDLSALSAAEVAARLDMNRTTAWRYLQGLSESGLVRELGDGRFALGARTVGLAEAYTRQWGELEAVAGAALVRLRDEVGETAALHLRQGWSRIVVRQIESRHELHRTYRELGRPISLLAGAPSRAILAALSRAEFQVFLTEHAHEHLAEGAAELDAAAVSRDVEEIRARGYATSSGARVPGVASVAAAVHDMGGHVIGAVNATGPAPRMPDDAVPRVATSVTGAARWIERQLWRPAHSGASPVESPS